MRRYGIGMMVMMVVALMLAGCMQGDDRRYDEGVSVELAQWRKETIGDLRYALRFDIPERRDEAVEGEQLMEEQRSRIGNPDRIREFDFVCRAVSPDTLTMDSVFVSLLKAENRRVEPWAEKALAYLNHPSREGYAVKYIRPGLEVLQEVQRTGDIFFPKKWANALLKNHRSDEARHEVEAFFDAHPDYPVLLKNKVLQVVN